MRVIIVGAGIGGGALALGLQKTNVDYVLLEQAHALAEIGAGIQLSSNGVRILDALGVGDELTRFCIEPDAHHFSDWQTGEVYLRTPLRPQVQQTFGFPYYHAHRPDLLDALSAKIDAERLHLGVRVTSVSQDDAGVSAQTADGRRFNGDVLVGADGIHSVIREQVFKPDPPRRSGYVAWRGVVDTDDIRHLNIWGRGCRAFTTTSLVVRK